MTVTGVTGQTWICDYDIPAEPKARRMQFYRRLWKILAVHNIVADRSTQSVWILDSEIIAEEIYNLAARYGHSNLYQAVKVEARSTCHTSEKLMEVIVR